MRTHEKGRCGQYECASESHGELVYSKSVQEGMKGCEDKRARAYFQQQFANVAVFLSSGTQGAPLLLSRTRRRSQIVQ